MAAATALGTAWQNIFQRSICRPNVRCRGMESSTTDTEYTAYHAPTGEEDNRLNVLYLVDDDKLKRIAREYFSSRPVAAIILIDNYEELLQSARENERSQIMGEIEYQIECYVENYNGVIKKLEKDRFFVAFEERYMRSIVEERFTILDTVRKINANGRMPATLSIGVGRDAQSLLQAEKFASQALDMALGRGGDQAAVKNKNGYEFYGGVSKGIEKRTKVKTRIVAAALMELLDSCSNVLIMGHRFADLDCLGSAVGLYQSNPADGQAGQDYPSTAVPTWSSSCTRVCWSRALILPLWSRRQRWSMCSRIPC